MNWLLVIIIFAVVCGILGYIFGDEGNRKENAASSAAIGAVGCGATIFYFAAIVIGFLLIIRLIGWLFS